MNVGGLQVCLGAFGGRKLSGDQDDGRLPGALDATARKRHNMWRAQASFFFLAMSGDVGGPEIWVLLSVGVCGVPFGSSTLWVHTLKTMVGFI